MVYPQVNDPVSIPCGTPNGTLFVPVNRTYGEQKTDPLTRKRISLEDCARGYWREANLTASRGFNCDWLMATSFGRIVGVWKIDKYYGWLEPKLTPKATWPGDPSIYPNNNQGLSRRGCILIPVDKATWDKFVGQEVCLGRNPNPLRGYFV